MLDYTHRTSLPAIKSRVARHLKASFAEGNHAFFAELQAQLEGYFAGARTAFEIPLVFAGTDFQKRVWASLLQIPFGETRSYKAQALALESPDAIRAVARANGENALAIIVPCHRVVGERGSLTGYSGGLAAKQWLLNHEQKKSDRATFQTELF